jgi:hypothetical protein
MTNKKYNQLVNRIQNLNSIMSSKASSENIEIFFELIEIKDDYITNFNEFSSQERQDLSYLISTTHSKHHDEMKYIQLEYFGDYIKKEKDKKP